MKIIIAIVIVLFIVLAAAFNVWLVVSLKNMLERKGLPKELVLVLIMFFYCYLTLAQQIYEALL